MAAVNLFMGGDLSAGFDAAFSQLQKRLNAQLTEKINKINTEQAARSNVAFQDSQHAKMTKRKTNFVSIQGKLEGNMKSVVDLRKLLNELKGFIRDTKTSDFNLKRSAIETKLDGLNYVVDGLINTGGALADLRRDGSLIVDAADYNGFATQADRDAASAAIDVVFTQLNQVEYAQRKNINVVKGVVKQLDGQLLRQEAEIQKIRLEEKERDQLEIRKMRNQNDATLFALQNKIDSSILTGMFFDGTF